MAKAIKVKEGLFWVGALNPTARLFDVTVRIPYGTTYNSFLLVGKTATVLVDTVIDDKYTEFEGRIESVIGREGRIDYVVLNHTEPDHSGALDRVMALHPEATIVATATALKNIEQICNRTFAKTVPVTNRGQPGAIDIGGLSLTFVVAPLLHWPDTMFTYVPELGVVMTCDFLGEHYCAEDIFKDVVHRDDARRRQSEEMFREYYRSIMSPFATHVLRGLERLGALDFDTVCCSHGPIIRGDTRAHMDLYREWAARSCAARGGDAPSTVIAYVSAYGFTKQLAETIAKEVRGAGHTVALYDMSETDTATAVGALEHARGLLLGTPTINGEALPPIWDVCSRLNPIVHSGLAVGVFGSFGWSGEGARNVQGRLEQLKPRLHAMDRPLAVRFKPSEQDLDLARAWARDYVSLVKNS